MPFKKRFFFALRASVPLALTVLAGLYALLVTVGEGQVGWGGPVLSLLTLLAWALFLFLAEKKKRRGEMWFLTVFWGIGLASYLLFSFLPGKAPLLSLALNFPVLSLSSFSELLSVTRTGAKLFLNLLPGTGLLLAGILTLIRTREKGKKRKKR